MLTVTKEGQVTGDYWAGLQQVERQRSKALIQQKESQQSQDFIAATRSAENRKTKEKKELPVAAKANGRKPTLYDLHKDRVGELYAQGWTPRQIEAEIAISVSSIKKILARLVREM